ncbi:hypothetical protein [Desulfomonile tiedjei]|uniref:Transposase n=1 Tax=Desulfomonile tiedjei (strain ATCC 49306 / DSM 6799 / DCB-1) TaxID=706587 RepID=I4CDT0_DESTA|nr:hypothetical protein [Desulfomonile tiedjei]AFM27721.1 hypothetical protein Desti_5114 [Desulfomonile tiedjei DSM 6799]
METMKDLVKERDRLVREHDYVTKLLHERIAMLEEEVKILRKKLSKFGSHEGMVFENVCAYPKDDKGD